MKNFPIRLTGNRILVEPLPKEEEEYNGIIIPTSANADLSTGRVVMLSGALEDVVKKGEIAIYPSKSGLGQVVGNKGYIWLEIEQVWAFDSPNGQDKGDSL